jgi:hypothetical protein
VFPFPRIIIAARSRSSGLSMSSDASALIR